MTASTTTTTTTTTTMMMMMTMMMPGRLAVACRFRTVAAFPFGAAL